MGADAGDHLPEVDSVGGEQYWGTHDNPPCAGYEKKPLTNPDGEPAGAWSSVTAESFVAQYASSGNFSGSVAIAREGEIIYEAGYGRADYEQDPWRIENLVQFVYGETSGVRSAENWRTNHRVDRKFSSTAYAFGQLLFNRDELAGLEYRLTPTAGIGRTLFEGNRGFFRAEVGGGAVHEKRLGRAVTTAPSAYLGLDLERTWRDGKKVTADFDFVANLDDVDLSFWTLDTKLLVPVCAWMDLTVGVRLDYVFEPPGGAESLDVLMVVGLNVRLSDL